MSNGIYQWRWTIGSFLVGLFVGGLLAYNYLTGQSYICTCSTVGGQAPTWSNVTPGSSGQCPPTGISADTCP